MEWRKGVVRVWGVGTRMPVLPLSCSVGEGADEAASSAIPCYPAKCLGLRYITSGNSAPYKLQSSFRNVGTWAQAGPTYSLLYLDGAEERWGVPDISCQSYRPQAEGVLYRGVKGAFGKIPADNGGQLRRPLPIKHHGVDCICLSSV